MRKSKVGPLETPSYWYSAIYFPLFIFRFHSFLLYFYFFILFFVQNVFKFLFCRNDWPNFPEITPFDLLFGSPHWMTPFFWEKSLIERPLHWAFIPPQVSLITSSCSSWYTIFPDYTISCLDILCFISEPGYLVMFSFLDCPIITHFVLHCLWFYDLIIKINIIVILLASWSLTKK